MKLNRLYIESFKNLEKLEIDFSKHEGLTLLIGNNGSGKSNLLELLSSIFCNFFDKPDYEADCELQYFNSSGKFINIIIKSTGILFTVEGDPNIIPYDYLPKRVIAIYSGDESRLWEKYYLQSYKNFIKEITGDKAIAFPRMLFLNKHYWHISLLCLLCSEAEDVKKFVATNLGIDISSPIIIYFKKNSPKFKNSHIKEFTDSLDDVYDLTDFKKTFGTDPDLFLKLFIAFTDKNNKLISDIIIGFNSDLTQNDLSEGQKKQLLVKAALEFAGQEDTLFLLDEPDAHVHVSNKKVILDIIEPYKVNRHVILTTHSPTIVQTADEKHITLLENGKIDPLAQDKVKAIKHLVGKDSFYNVIFGTKDLLLVEGKTDKIHLENAYSKLKDDYPEMDFDIISMNSCTFIKQAMLGLSNSEIKWNKKFIAILDNDKDGGEAINKNFKLCDFGDGVKQIQDGNGNPSNEFYAFLIPKPANYTEHVTIENYYDSSKYEVALKKAIEEKIGYFDSLSIDKISDDLKNKSKIILAEDSKGFEKEDFERFRLIFDSIKVIQEH